MMEPATAQVIHMSDVTPAPQLEDGYLRLSNELYDAILAFKFSLRELKIVLAVARKTYGFNKKSDDIALSTLSEMTGIDRAHLCRAIRDLVEMRVIVCTNGNYSNNLSINKHYRQWLLPKEQQHKGVAERATEVLPKEQQKCCRKSNVNRQPQKTTPKDSKPLMRNLRCANEDFATFWQAWPKKKAKHRASRAFERLAPDAELLATILAAVETQKRSPEWVKDGGQFIPYAEAWINGRRWEDEVEAEQYDATALDVFDRYNRILAEAGWPEAVTDTFSAQRKADVAVFLGFSSKPDWVTAYFTWLRDNLAPKPGFGFDWAIRRETFIRAREGNFAALRESGQ